MDLEKAAELLSSLKPVRLEPALCVQARSARAACTACVDVCPAGALTLRRGPQLGEGCVACGLCVTACSPGVFRLETPSDATVLSAARKVAGDVVIFACDTESGELTRRAPGRVVSVPCIGYLSVELLAGVLATGHSHVLLWRPPACDGCVRSAGAALAAASARQLNTFLPSSCTFGAPAVLPAADRAVAASGSQAAGNIDLSVAGRDRRAFFGEALRGGGGLLQLLFADWLKKPAPASRTLAADHVGVASRRELFAEAIEALPVAPDAGLDMRAPKVDANCTLCTVCSRLCPSGALKLADSPDQRSLVWQAARCSDCDLCRVVCPVKAVSAEAGVTVGRIRSAEPERLVTGLLATCDCGTTYWRTPEGPERCVACRMKE